jgi:hypothetical protein
MLLCYRGQLPEAEGEELANRLISQASTWLTVCELERELAS